MINLNQLKRNNFQIKRKMINLNHQKRNNFQIANFKKMINLKLKRNSFQIANFKKMIKRKIKYIKIIIEYNLRIKSRK